MVRIYVWNHDQTKKIKLKEVRDFNIDQNDDGSFNVTVYGGFGGPVLLKNNIPDHKGCIDFIDSLTEKTE